MFSEMLDSQKDTGKCERGPEIWDPICRLGCRICFGWKLSWEESHQGLHPTVCWLRVFHVSVESVLTSPRPENSDEEAVGCKKLI